MSTRWDFKNVHTNERINAAQGGVTSLCSYMRTGQYSLDMGGPWAEFIPELLRR
mgnify:CR=1 FL=1